MAKSAILIGSDVLGGPDRALGQVLMGNFLRLLGERAEMPDYIVLWNAGVLLATEDATTLDYLLKLQERDVKIISCRTCIEFFGVEGKMAAGEVDGMVRIQDILTTHQVLTI